MVEGMATTVGDIMWRLFHKKILDCKYFEADTLQWKWKHNFGDRVHQNILSVPANYPTEKIDRTVMNNYKRGILSAYDMYNKVSSASQSTIPYSGYYNYMYF